MYRFILLDILFRIVSTQRRVEIQEKHSEYYNIHDNRTVVVGVMLRQRPTQYHWSFFEAVAPALTEAIKDFQNAGSLKDYDFR